MNYSSSYPAPGTVSSGLSHFNRQPQGAMDGALSVLGETHASTLREAALRRAGNGPIVEALLSYET